MPVLAHVQKGPTADLRIIRRRVAEARRALATEIDVQRRESQ